MSTNALEPPAPSTKRLLVEMGCYSLDLIVAADVDLDSRFKALCNDTGETLWVNGWLIDSEEEIA